MVEALRVRPSERPRVQSVEKLEDAADGAFCITVCFEAAGPLGLDLKEDIEGNLSLIHI